MPDETIVIQASHWNQALIVAEQLGLPKPDGRERGGVVVVFADDYRRICGLLPSRLVFAEPRLEYTIVDRIKHDDCRLHLRDRFMRSLAERGVLKGATDYERRKYVESLIERVTT